ncbi:MAG: methionine synthase, partial [Anaerolineae bacterium]|nr:methionine synthase [Anaerolineae bacterium]
RAIGFFEQVFDGSEPTEMVLAYAKGQLHAEMVEQDFPQTALARLAWKAPYPLIRHHFGLPTVQATREGVKRIAEAQVLDVISLGTDQDAQANFFHPERQDPRRTGAGGVPVRTPDDFSALYAASRRGNYPLLRTYSGTDDFLPLAEMYLETINNAWCAIPIFWFNQMDGRGPWDLEGSIREHQRLMAWYGERDIPVEVNEPHHWGMRDAPDVVFVTTAYLSAYNARAFGVRDYVAQFMFNSPPGLSDVMDLAKMLTCLDLVEPLAGPDFRIWKQTRTGLLSYPLDVDAARGHLSASVYLQMALQPHIVHVVSHTEAHHAATPEDVIEACKLARQAIENALHGQPDMACDPAIRDRREELTQEAQITLEAIAALGGPEISEPFTDPATLTRAVDTGILDAPHLLNNPFARGQIASRVDGRGACLAVDPVSGKPVTEEERIARLGIC